MVPCNVDWTSEAPARVCCATEGCLETSVVKLCPTMEQIRGLRLAQWIPGSTLLLLGNQWFQGLSKDCSAMFSRLRTLPIGHWVRIRFAGR